jgi:hypothetical protein
MTRRLRERRRRLVSELPPLEEVLRGSLVRRVLRCGKPRCRCADGEGHHATYLSVTLPGGRTEQLSLPEHLLEQAERWIANYHAWWEAIEQVSAVNRELLRAARQSARGARRRRPRG